VNGNPGPNTVFAAAVPVVAVVTHAAPVSARAHSHRYSSVDDPLSGSLDPDASSITACDARTATYGLVESARHVIGWHLSQM